MQVWKAQMSGGQVIAAKKLLRPGPKEEAQMAKEIALLSGLFSPHIVRFLGADVTPGQQMVVFTEFCERGDLYRALQTDAQLGQRRQLSWHGRLASPHDEALTVPLPMFTNLPGQQRSLFGHWAGM